MSGFFRPSQRDQQRMRRFMSVGDMGIAAPVSVFTTDDFSTNTIANYTVTKDSGSPTWTISGGAMNANAALSTQSVCTYNSFSAANCSVEVVIIGAGDSGVVVRFQDQNNFYLAAFSSTQIRLYKRVAGTFTQLGSTVSYGGSGTLRLTANGTTISLSLNGVVQISVTDSAISAAGKVGMRSNANGGDFFDSFSYG